MPDQPWNGTSVRGPIRSGMILGVTPRIAIRSMLPTDPEALTAAFAPLGWPGKDLRLFQGHLHAQQRGETDCFVAADATTVAGYVCVNWRSSYPAFRDAGVPEIADLNVLPDWRKHGIGSALLDAAENAIAKRSNVAGLGVGLYADYGPAWRLYIARGYVPDGRGVVYDGQQVDAGTSITIDDAAVLMMTKTLTHGDA